MSFYCNLEVDGKPCHLHFDSRRKLKEHLVPAPHCGMKVVCPFCITKEATFSRPADLKNHVLRRHKEATASINIPTDDLFSENNCFWISCWPAIYRSLVEPTDRNSRASSKLRTLILDWTKKIMFTPKRSRQEWLEGWEAQAWNFRVDSSTEYNPGSPGLFTIISISLVPNNLVAVLEEGSSLYQVEVDNNILLDPRGIASLSRKMAVLKQSNYSIPPPCEFTRLNLEHQRINHFSTSLGIEEKFIKTISKFQKFQTTEPELELFAESDIESMPSPARIATLRTPSPAKSEEPKRKKICLKEDLSMKPRSTIPPATLPMLPVSLRTPAPIIPTECTATPITATLPAESAEQPQETLSDRAKTLLAQGCMPLFPPARRQWEQEGTVEISSGSIHFTWPPKDFTKLSPDQKLLEIEYAAMSLRRSKPGGEGPVDRAMLIDNFNFLVLPGTAVLSPKKSLGPANKSRVYMYQALRNIARGNTCTPEDENLIRFLEASRVHRNRQWDSLISTVDGAGVPLRLTE